MSEIKDINETSERFSSKPSDFSVISDGKVLNGSSAKEYLEAKRKSMLKVAEIIPVGGVVQLQSTGLVVTVTANNGEVFKYMGVSPDYPERSFLFNQEDIDFIVQDSIGGKTL